MALIQWTDELSVQIDSIDAQHKKLVDIINAMHEAMQVGKANDFMRRILADLTAYTQDHFAYEERLFKRHGYAQAAVHHDSHAILIEQLKELQGQMEQGRAISIKVFSFLKKWLSEHILKEDRQYSQFLRSHGVT